MVENGLLGKLTRLIMATTDSLQFCVKIYGALSDPTTIKAFRQGGGIFCLLFNISLEDVMKRTGFNMGARSSTNPASSSVF